MTPKEKAKELFDKYFEFVEAYSVQGQNENAKRCALIAVDEIIDLVKHIDVDSEDYWQEVKQEIINL
jgi:hypothetical protein